MSTSVVVSTLPPCDFCTEAGYKPIRPAKYDFKTTMGPWANGCHTHYYQFRQYKELGTGKGQKLEVK